MGLVLLPGDFTNPNADVVEVTAHGDVDFTSSFAHGDHHASMSEGRHFDAPDRIGSGWTTVRFHNEAEETHFAFLYRLPEGKTHEDVLAETAPPYDHVLQQRQAGKLDKQAALETLFERLPEWSTGITAMGGPGLVAPGRTAQATMRLEPGTYVMECYVKTPHGHFHAAHGMSQELTVTDSDSGGSPPEADVGITLANGEIAVKGTMTPGEQTVAVRYREHPEGRILGNDVHLARVGHETDMEAVATWMDWLNVGGLKAPAPVEFLGGVHEMPAGQTAYFTVDVKPGRYAWIAEQPADQGMWQTFSVE
ncbi:MAG: hypothetical protein ABEL51_06170 [Salinibacter sp.]